MTTTRTVRTIDIERRTEEVFAFITIRSRSCGPYRRTVLSSATFGGILTVSSPACADGDIAARSVGPVFCRAGQRSPQCRATAALTRPTSRCGSFEVDDSDR